MVAVSDGVADDLAAWSGLARCRITTIYNPVATPDLAALQRAPVDHPWFQPGAPPVVMSAGRLGRAKDFPTLIRAFARVRRARPARLVIFGQGKTEAKTTKSIAGLRQLAAGLGVAGDVALPGFVANPFAYMARAGAFALSSINEGLPGVLIQAMACGCPVVSTDCPSGPAEILAGGRYGRLVPPGDDTGARRSHHRDAGGAAARRRAARARRLLLGRARGRAVRAPDAGRRAAGAAGGRRGTVARRDLRRHGAGVRDLRSASGQGGMPPAEMAAVVDAMARTLRHRGPDDAGRFVDADAGLAFGHRRLSIIDLSDAGHQPMASACGRFVITYNGEIYNFREVRRLLEQRGHRFEGHSDTEVLLAAIAEWGIEQALPRLHGMFAFALWDRRDAPADARPRSGRQEAAVLRLVRRRVPVHVRAQGLAPASRIRCRDRSRRARPADPARLDPRPVLDLPAASASCRPARCSASVPKAPGEPVLQTWWSAKEVAEAGELAPFAGSFDEAVAALDARLGDGRARSG